MCSGWRLRFLTRNIILTLLMVLTGCICTLSAKWADLNTAGGSNPVAEHYYDHPFIQVAGTYAAELVLFVAYKSLYSYRQCTNGDMSLFGDQSFNPLIWIIPSMLDICSASLMYVGLTWTYAASYQIIRAIGMIITTFLSAAFFGTRLMTCHFIGMVLVSVGIIVVGLGDYVFFNDSSGLDKNTVLAGNLLVIIAQFVLSLQMIVQEKLIKKYKILPIQALGWESIFGITAMISLLIPMYFIPWHLPQSSSSWQEHVRFEDSIDAFKQWAYTPYVLVPSLGGLMISTTVLNLIGLTVTETWDSITRMALMIGSTIIVWTISLAVGWQKFEPLQPVGYFIIFIGVLIHLYGYYSIPQQLRWICRKIASICVNGNERLRTPIMALQ